MLKKYDIAAFVGRFSPAHLGQISVIIKGLDVAEHVVVLVGSASSPRSHRNPFLYVEREQMILRSIPVDLRSRVLVCPLEDSAYNDTAWVTNVQTQVERAAWKIGFVGEPKVVLIGHSKDESSYYLKMFPQWDSVEAENYKKLNSTQIRNMYFSNIGHMWIKDADGHKIGDLPQDHIVSPYVKEFLEKFLTASEYKMICDEYEFVQKYKASWASAPYPVNLVTTDSLIIKSGHVLLVERGSLPGKGLLAMPGGYLNVNERAIDGMIRELREETKLKVPEAVLRGSITKHEIFDDPNRSSRGRVLTIAYLIDLGNGSLDKVKGNDDAKSAFWMPLSELKREDFFEDHFDIIKFLLGMG